MADETYFAAAIQQEISERLGILCRRLPLGLVGVCLTAFVLVRLPYGVCRVNSQFITVTLTRQ